MCTSEPGGCCPWDASRPYHGRFDDAAGVHSFELLQLPRAALPLPTRTVQRFRALPLSPGAGMGGALTRRLATVVGHRRRGPGDPPPGAY
ncbi:MULTISPECIES: hypothetical protein [Streptomyces]|uniref:hypothetical protein n=1 Tax=Streptomyces TaxID=1883 RepID=UPI001E4D12C0|nr:MULTISPECIES: hypothetical protein [Streptomyces]UFQ19668.1 hypothetical protein J2N69_34485 [Streptomyces huasconensis]WCL89287.1 hypothetical protein PPN52_34430 [Streptomyces sp. JCM 35825]